jgi:c-di-GMP-binding flagellar brake protein YcgR
MTEEKRINKRITLSLPINYEVLNTKVKDRENTVSKDISESGIKLIINKFYPPKTKFLIKIYLESINKTIETITETVWSSRLRFSNLYFCGMRFLEINMPNKNLLREYITIKSIT